MQSRIRSFGCRFRFMAVPKKLANHRSRPERAESGPLECHPNGHPHLVPDDDKQWVEATQTARDANVVAPA